MRDLEIQQLIMESVNRYTGIPGNNQPNYGRYSYPQRLQFLNDNLKKHILREEGDIKGYLALQKEVFDLCPEQITTENESLYKIINWVDGELESCKAGTPESNRLVISLLVFGEKYIDKMLNYNFKSLMAAGNLPALVAEKKVTIYLITTDSGRDVIEQASVTEKIKALGVIFHYTILPEEIENLLVDQYIIYWLLGACASLGIHYAKCQRAVFCHSFPDIVYNDKFYSELLRLAQTQKAILGSGMRSDETLMMPSIAPYLDEDTLAVPVSDLMAHHLNCIHLSAWPQMVNNRPDYWFYPKHHVMIWESENLVHINSPHVNAWWLDYWVLKDLPVRFFHTLDSEMDLVCKGQDYYIIQECDEVYQVELSAPNRQHMQDLYCDIGNAADNLWNCIAHRDTAKFFFREMRIRVNRNIRPLPDNYIPHMQVKSLQQGLFNMALSIDRYAKINLARPRTHNGYIFQ